MVDLANSAGDRASLRRYLQSNYTGDFDVGSLMTTLSDTCRCKVCTVTGWLGVSVLSVGKVASPMFDVYRSPFGSTSHCLSGGLDVTLSKQWP